ncbi:MAG TPA: MBL fold metallo-hydrolase [Acidobacteriota bacterium]|nr:MBL fold metallo-hydrolase [Acidobacteriota bacterium]
MQITVLGTRGEIDQTAPYHSRHSGLLIDGSLMVDVGEREFLDRAPKAVLITHLHPDHAYFVRAGAERPPAGIPLFAPESYKDYGVTVLEGPETIAGFGVRPVPSHHSLKVRSQGYLIARGSTRILYTGDLVWINKEHHALFEGLDLVITEASYFRKGGLIIRHKATGQIYGHTGVPDLVRLFKDYCRRIVLVHFGGWFYKDIGRARAAIRELGRTNGVVLEAGRDNQTIVV